MSFHVIYSNKYFNCVEVLRLKLFVDDIHNISNIIVVCGVELVSELSRFVEQENPFSTRQRNVKQLK